MRIVLILAMTLPLAGCWFVFIPGSVISGVGDALSGLQGQHCVAENAKPGDKVRAPNGTTWTVQKLEGTSSRCTNSFQPVRAVLTQD